MQMDEAAMTKAIQEMERAPAAALENLIDGLEALEGELRLEVIRCCDGEARFCEMYGCTSIGRIADKVAALRRTAKKERNPMDSAEPAPTVSPTSTQAPLAPPKDET